MKFTLEAVVFTCVAAVAFGCGQEKIELPDPGQIASGECGAWYPGGDDAGTGDTDADSDTTADDEGSYGFLIGDTLPCFVWESVRIGEEGEEPNTYINMGELFLEAEWDRIDEFQTKFGASIPEPRFVLLLFVAVECPACGPYVEAVIAARAELEARGVVIVGVARSYDLANTKDLTLAQADALLLEDGFVEDLHRTNDAEKHLGANVTFFNNYPQMALIRIADMKVIERTVDDAPAHAQYLTGPAPILELIDETLASP